MPPVDVLWQIIDDNIPTEDSAVITDEGVFPFAEDEGACFPVEDNDIPSFHFG